MYHFFVNQEQIGQDTVTVTGPDVNHIKNVLRMKPGEEVLISNGVDKDYVCRLQTITSDAVTAEIVTVTEGGTELPAKFYLFQGLPKSDKMEFLIQKAVELGVYQVIPVETRRTVVKLDAKKVEAKVRRWNAVSESAAKQSKRLIIPEVTGVMTFQEALNYAGGFDKNIIPFEHAEGMADTKAYFAGIRPGMSCGIFIGPEGGFSEEEIELLRQDAEVLSLGKRILRTDTAAICTMSMLMLELEEKTEGEC